MTEIPLCSVCCDVLGTNGGPTTLPCGHNGCVQCFKSVSARKPECPICRAPFTPGHIACNYELRHLIQAASDSLPVGSVDEDGWEAFPTSRMTSTAYAKDMSTQQTPPGAGYPALPGCEASAPPATASDLSSVLGGQSNVLSLTPPQWLPDSYASACGICHQEFLPVRRLRHHCRLCGRIFCNSCCNRKLLLPPAFRQQEPQRVCELCVTLLDPLQPFLAGSQAPYTQAPVHDVTDASSLRAWFNNPLSTSLEVDIFKATNIVRGFIKAMRHKSEREIPSSILTGAAGFAILSVMKVGAGWSLAVGTGVVLSRREDGSWSPPSAVGSAAVGWGVQGGAGLTDLLLVLYSRAALKAFTGGVRVGIGGNISVAVGPLGRQAEALAVVGEAGAATCYSYSCTRGAFLGVGVEGTYVHMRDAVNQRYYGRPFTARQLLLEAVLPPAAGAASLYEALRELMRTAEDGVKGGQAAVAAATAQKGEPGGSDAGAALCPILPEPLGGGSLGSSPEMLDAVSDSPERGRSPLARTLPPAPVVPAAAYDSDPDLEAEPAFALFE